MRPEARRGLSGTMRVIKTLPRCLPILLLRLAIALALFATPSNKTCDALLVPASPVSMSVAGVNTITTTYNSQIKVERVVGSRKRDLVRKFLRRRQDIDTTDEYNLKFSYDVDEFVVDDDSGGPSRAYLLIHPIGVGIGRWYYDRMLASLRERAAETGGCRLVFLSPDLLGSSTASAPVDSRGDGPRAYPLLNITDWSDQVCHLMDEYGRGLEDNDEGRRIASWTLVTNGGCAPIALDAAARRPGNVSNVVISSPPRLPFFLQSSDPRAVMKAYRLCGVVGRLFWWYSLRRDGRFIQSFSEKNLVGDPESLGPDWLPNCLDSARSNGGRSRYSTFAFLAGALQDGCVDSLNALKDSNVKIDFIRGSDKRRNRAKSWFWRRNKNNQPKEKEQTIAEYVRDNGNGGRELSVGGRISLAWEDPDHYAASLLELTI